LLVRGDVAERSDRELLAAHAAGDPHAFGLLIARHRDRMWAVALRTMRDQEEAADALQDACISAFRAAGSFRAESAVTTWLHRIVVNACLDRLRRRKVRPTVPLDDQGPAEPALPRDEMADRELAMDISAALATLPDDQRAAIVLVDVQGYPVGDAAVALGVAEGTIKSRCARGRARLAIQLGHLWNRSGPGPVEGGSAPSRPPAGSAGSAPPVGGSAPDRGADRGWATGGSTDGGSTDGASTDGGG
jgi:RNA polymerase sigma-70 factor (ECF subfamily)